MPGGLIQLIAYGAQDFNLGQNLNYFSHTYRRFTNFAMEGMDFNSGSTIRTCNRKYNNFEIIDYDDDPDNLDTDTDMLYPVAINLRNLNKNRLFINCSVPKRAKKKDKKFDGGGNMTFFKFKHESNVNMYKQNQKQIKSQIKRR